MSETPCHMHVFPNLLLTIFAFFANCRRRLELAFRVRTSPRFPACVFAALASSTRPPAMTWLGIAEEPHVLCTMCVKGDNMRGYYSITLPCSDDSVCV